MSCLSRLLAELRRLDAIAEDYPGTDLDALYDSLHDEIEAEIAEEDE